MFFDCVEQLCWTTFKILPLLLNLSWNNQPSSCRFHQFSTAVVYKASFLCCAKERSLSLAIGLLKINVAYKDVIWVSRNFAKDAEDFAPFCGRDCYKRLSCIINMKGRIIENRRSWSGMESYTFTHKLKREYWFVDYLKFFVSAHIEHAQWGHCTQNNVLVYAYGRVSQVL